MVPISERVLTLLGRRRTIQNQGWVFPSPKKYSHVGHFSLSTVEHQFVDARRKAGLPEALVLYCARQAGKNVWMMGGGEIIGSFLDGRD